MNRCIAIVAAAWMGLQEPEIFGDDAPSGESTANTDGGDRESEDPKPLTRLEHEGIDEDVAKVKAWIDAGSLEDLAASRACVARLRTRGAGRRGSVPPLTLAAITVLVPGGPPSLQAAIAPLRSLNVIDDESTARNTISALRMADVELITAIGVVQRYVNEKEKEAVTAEAATVLAALKALSREVQADLAAVDRYLVAVTELPDLGTLYEERLLDHVDQIARRHGCRKNGILCLTIDGALFGSEEGASELEPGFVGRLRANSHVTVHVFGQANEVGDSTAAVRDSITLKMGEIERTSALTRDDTKQSGLRCGNVEAGYVLVKSEVLTVPNRISAREAEVQFTRTPANTAQAPVQARYAAQIEHGHYYVDVGLMVPFVLDGQQTLTDRAENGARYVLLERKLLVTAALALNVFPGGRRKDALTPFGDLGCDPRLEARELKRCRRRAVGRPFAELFGFQLGVDLDITNLTDRFFFGVVIEPLTGLTFSTGLAVIEVEEPRDRVYEGQLVTMESDLAPVRRHRPRWYGAFVLSYDLVRFVQQVRARFEGERG